MTIISELYWNQTTEMRLEHYFDTRCHSNVPTSILCTILMTLVSYGIEDLVVLQLQRFETAYDDGKKVWNESIS